MTTPAPARLQGRPFIGILFECCRIYARIYRSADGSRYDGRCPRCATPVQFRVGHEGSGNRFWRVR